MNDSSRETTVPEQWSVELHAEPASARRILPVLTPLVMPVLWLIPKRIGRSLPAMGWRPALAVHVFSAVTCLGLIALAEEFPGGYFDVPDYIEDREVLPWAHMTFSEYLRAPYAALVLTLHRDLKGWGDFWGAVLVFLLVEMVALLLAGLLMPFATAGERLGRVYKRCILLVWWSTSSLLVLGFGWLLFERYRVALGFEFGWQTIDWALLTLWMAWWLFVLWRSTHDYTGLPKGPAWEPVPTRCMRCGYRLVGLPKKGRCPECGLAVSESLPETQSLPPFGSKDTRQPLHQRWLRTVKLSLRGGPFFAHLAVRQGHRHARQFVVCCALASVVLFDFSLFFVAYLPRQWLELLLQGIVVSSCVFLVYMGIVGIVALAVSGFGRRQLYERSVAVFYSCPLLVPLLAISPLHVWAFVPASTGFRLVLGVAAVALVSGCLWLWVSRALRCARFASA